MTSILLCFLVISVLNILGNCSSLISSKNLNRTRYHIHYKRDFPIRHCTPKQTDHIENALQELGHMLQTTRSRLRDLYRYTSQPEIPPISDQDPLLRSTFHTWTTIIDGHFLLRSDNTPGVPSLVERQPMLHRLDKLRDLAETMASKIVERPNTEFYCTDTWLKPVDLQGNRPQTNMNDQFDSRESVDGDSERTWVPGQIKFRPPDDPDFDQTPRGHVTCELAGPYTCVVTLNPYEFEWFEDWSPNKRGTQYPGEKSYTDMKMEQSYKPGDWHLKDLTEHHLSALLAHELTHATTITTNGKKLEDVDTRYVAEDAWGWDSVLQIARIDPVKGANNAENFMFLVIALYLDNWDWSTGFNALL